MGDFGVELRHTIFGFTRHVAKMPVFLYAGHPLQDATCGPLQLAHFACFVSLFGHPL